MLYCQGHTISFQEVPNEVSLVFLVADCRYRCKGCHSPQLRCAIGENLLEYMREPMEQYADVATCVCFMGDGQDTKALLECANLARSKGFCTALYTGANNVPQAYYEVFDYIKFGPYIEERGGLDNPNTNQVMVKIERDDGMIYMTDITSEFWKEKK